MKNNRRFKFELLLFSSALILALGVRLYNLGEAPLSESEAGLAMQALKVAQPDSHEVLVVGPQPGYIMLTGFLFSFFGSSNFLARFWPALAGGLLIISPFLLSRSPEGGGSRQRYIWPLTALIVAFGLALDPGLVTVSRSASGPMMALSFTLLAFGLWNIRQPVLAGIVAGLALLSGPAIIVGGLGLILAWLSLKLFRLSKSAQHPGAESSGKNPETNIAPSKEGNKTAQFFRTDSGQFLVSAVAAIIVIGTLFLIYPQGLSAWFEGIPEYLQGWTTLPSIPPGRLAAALLVYQPFAVLFALIAILLLFSKPVSGGKSNRVAIHFAAAWSIFAFLLILMYPNRQVADTVWVLVPIWIMAGFALTKLLSLKISHPISMALAIFLIVLSGLFWFTLASITQFSTNLTETNLRVAILIGILALGILAAILVALGWSWDVSRSGLVIGVCTAFGLYLISVMWGASQLRFNSSRELWTPIPAPGQAVLFDKVLGELSSWNSGFGNYIDILSTVEAPSLQWELRNFPEARFIKQPETSELPSVIITLEGEELPAFSASYRGEDFVWWTSPGWMGALPPDVVNWLVFRKAPIQKERIIMWARGDLFPGGTLEAEPAPEEIP